MVFNSLPKHTIMKSFKTVCIVLAMLPMLCQAQTQTTHKHKKHASSTTIKALPGWATAHKYDGQSHVYFPDYYTYYDPNRGGYVFWKNGNWSFTPTVPPYMNDKDLGKERIQILKGLSLDLHPELDYPRYMKLYPAVHEYNDVPVPRTSDVSGD